MSMLWKAGALQTSIIKAPSGRFIFVGEVPLALTEECGGLFPQRVSKAYETREAAEAALRAVEGDK